MISDARSPELSARLQFSSVADFPTHHGTFKIRAIRDQAGLEHVLVYKGDPTGKHDVPVRIHSECRTSEVFHSLRCDCSEQLDAALDYFESEGIGVMVYLRQEGRGIGLFNKIEAYALQDRGLDTVAANNELGFAADQRTYEVAVEVLRVLGVKSVRLLTNNPRKVEAVSRHQIGVERIPHRFKPNSHNAAYLLTKQLKMEHFL
ncbi:MAG: GTP cyclohydrolase II [Planctomycetota bacterium]|nr:GTP cyclohydrolase II [Planctomycetota bacterium]